jgi:hypothetical protein
MSSPNQSGSAASGSRVEQLRADIDSGRTGDKVAHPDPAAAPLGADDEAAGGKHQDMTRGVSRIASPPDQLSDARRGTPSGNPGAQSRTWIYIAAVSAVLVIMLLLGTMMPYGAP